MSSKNRVARIPFLRTEVVVGRRQGDFYNTITTEKEKVAATNLDVNVILPIRWPVGENIFFNFGAGLQQALRTLVYSPTPQPRINCCILLLIQVLDFCRILIYLLEEERTRVWV
jgi:hypothetical protein